eukprot:TRINITY_DN3166_c0_g2_i1.p1 TRINITY_DN3166_c0_g2~~TRINITY_DN3166_c0_g2_i1.p1  ORF type:complete len:555 (-),score=150.57 TRINITY_DN3166_c0_g2_i1:240-1874(-)
MCYVVLIILINFLSSVRSNVSGISASNISQQAIDQEIGDDPCYQNGTIADCFDCVRSGCVWCPGIGLHGVCVTGGLTGPIPALCQSTNWFFINNNCYVSGRVFNTNWSYPVIIILLSFVFILFCIFIVAFIRCCTIRCCPCEDMDDDDDDDDYKRKKKNKSSRDELKKETFKSASSRDIEHGTPRSQATSTSQTLATTTDTTTLVKSMSTNHVSNMLSSTSHAKDNNAIQPKDQTKPRSSSLSKKLSPRTKSTPRSLTNKGTSSPRNALASKTAASPRFQSLSLFQSPSTFNDSTLTENPEYTNINQHEESNEIELHHIQMQSVSGSNRDDVLDGVDGDDDDDTDFNQHYYANKDNTEDSANTDDDDDDDDDNKISNQDESLSRSRSQSQSQSLSQSQSQSRSQSFNNIQTPPRSTAPMRKISKAVAFSSDQKDIVDQLGDISRNIDLLMRDMNQDLGPNVANQIIKSSQHRMLKEEDEDDDESANDTSYSYRMNDSFSPQNDSKYGGSSSHEEDSQGESDSYQPDEQHTHLMDKYSSDESESN